MRLTNLISSFILLACLITVNHAAHSAQPADLLQSFDRTQLLIATGHKKCLLFDVYIAATPQQRSQGLMFIREMADQEGMIFFYPRPTMISMWMKNTLIPLDMLFIDASGTVATIHRGAVPLSTDIIESGQEVSAVLELNAGAVEKFGIKIGNPIIFSGDEQR